MNSVQSAPSRHVHFVGFRGLEYISAVRVFGEPDFIHMVHDFRMYGDVGDGDLILHGPKSTPDTISQYSWQDHEIW